MAITKTTTLNVETEPSCYHQLSTDELAFAVHRSFAYFDNAGADVEKAAKEAFNAFIDDRPELILYKIKISSCSIVESKPVEIIKDADDTTLSDIFKRWLSDSDKRHAKYNSSLDDTHEINDDPLDETGRENERELAGNLIRSTANWDAPIPHKLHLSVVAKVSGINFDDKEHLWVIAPKGLETGWEIKLDQKPVAEAAEQSKDFTITFSKTNDHGDKEEVVTYALEEFKQFPLVNENGFLIVNTTCNQDFRTFKRLEERSGSLLNTLAQLLELEPWLLEFEHAVHNPPKENITKTPEQLSILKKWLAEAGILTALDSILIALHMPGMEHAEGQVLSEWISLLQHIMHPTALKEKTRLALKISDYAQRVIIAKAILEIDEHSEFASLSTILKGEDDSNITMQQLLASLQALSAKQQSEAGIEQTIIALFKYTQNTLTEVTGLSAENITTALNQFETLLSDDFNGAESVARDCSSVFANLLTQQAKEPLQTNSCLGSNAKQQLEKSNYFSHRLLSTPPFDNNLFESVLSQLLQIRVLELTDDHRQEVTTLLSTALTSITTQIFPADTPKRFVPDTHPMPLPVRIATDMDPTKLDKFNQQFNGIGVLIQRENEGWKQACLTKLLYQQHPSAPGNVIEEFALQPVIPLINDGKAALYLEYHGFPLATQAFSAVGAEGIEQKTVSKPPFYYLSDVTENGPPALIYGKEYKVASYVVAMSGSLPQQLQRDGKPWLPKTIITELNNVPEEQIFKTTYQRHTAIGRTSYHHLPNSTAEQRRIGTKYPDVLPLALDYPRLVLGKYEHLDLLRNSDGTGGLDLGKLLAIEPSETRVKLTNIKVNNGNAAIKIALLNQPSTALGDIPIVEVPHVQIAKASLTIMFEKSEGNDSYYAISDDCITFKLPQNLCTDSWLRVFLVDGEVVSFAMPEADRSDKYYSTVSELPLLLLANTNDSEWKAPFNEGAKFEVVLPRVGFLDFEHWVKNEQFIGHLSWPADAPKLSDILTYAYVLRGFSDELARLLDRLPDPAVEAILVGVLPIDQIGENANTSHDGKINLMGLPSPQSLSINNEVNSWKVEDFEKLFQAWDRAYTVAVNASCRGNQSTLDITTTPYNSTTSVSITVPEGCINHLSVRPLVNKKFVDSEQAPLAAELKQLAVGEYPVNAPHPNDYFIFDGASLLIESMCDNLAVGDFIPQVMPKGNKRSYHIQVKNPPVLVSDIQVHSRTWRFSGRPIYNWLNPQPNNNWSESAAVEVSNLVRTELEHFETELDFNRDRADFVSDPLKRLTPGDTSTIVKTVDWPSPTANYFRHRYTLYSRYRGAMLTGTKSVNLSGDNNWLHRVVMLADASRIEITRPQLRAIIPLSSPPEEKSVATPPLTCVVQEPPFAYGGLAERVLAGIYTGVGYGFAQQNSAVSAIDTRKEIGKDPRFTVRCMATDDAQSASFLNEGPVGLTFDRSATNAPAWVNSQYIISPQLLNQENQTVEPETFIAVRMIRMLDPNWVYQHQPATTSSRGENGVEFELNKSYQAIFENTGGNLTVDKSICLVNKTTDKWLVTIAKEALEPSIAGTSLSEVMLDLCSASTNLIKSIGLIHRPMADGVYVLLVLGYPSELNDDARIINGQPDVPYLLAEICWQLPENHSDKATFERCKSVIPFYASASTERQWARTAQSASVVYIKGRDKPVSITELYFEGGKLMHDDGKEVMPTTKPAEAGAPQTVHRHLLTVFTKDGKGLGRPIQEFYSAKLIIDNDWPDLTDVSGVRLAEIQTPARPIAAAPAGDTAIPAQYKNVLFDNQSIGHQETTKYLFVIRAVTPPTKNLNIIVKIDEEKKGDISFTENQTIQSCVIELRQPSKQIFVSLDGMDKEHWFDISMLPLRHSTEQYNYDFDFNWLFTNIGGDTDYQTSVAPTQLAQTYEAAAQLVSWSNIIKPK